MCSGMRAGNKANSLMRIRNHDWQCLSVIKGTQLDIYTVRSYFVWEIHGSYIRSTGPMEDFIRIL